MPRRSRRRRCGTRPRSSPVPRSSCGASRGVASARARHARVATGADPAGPERPGGRVIDPDIRREPRIRHGIREAAWAFVGARLLLFGISVAGGGTLPLPLGQPPTDAGFPAPVLEHGWHMLFTATQRQDAAWFLRLATTGYAPHDGSAAFFPLYPLAVRCLGWFPGLGPLGAALIVGNAAFFGALLMLHALTRLDLGA